MNREVGRPEKASIEPPDQRQEPGQRLPDIGEQEKWLLSDPAIPESEY